MEYRCPSRISIGSKLGTVRFLGELPAWPGETAVGIEWDDPSRGKHSGSLNGIKYFECRVPGSGSFIKASRKKDLPREFVEALRNKYTSEADELEKRDIKFGGKVAERVGFDKIKQRQSKLDALSFVSLDYKCIAYSSPGLASICGSIQDLDISYNIFECITEIAEIAEQLPNISSLRLNGNRLLSWELPKDKAKAAFTKLRSVGLGSTLITPEIIAALPMMFPCVTEVSLFENLLDTKKLEFKSPWESLESLDLSYNNFEKIPEFSSKMLGNLRILNLSRNRIGVIESAELEWAKSLTRLEAIDLRHNQIAEWKDIDTLAEIFHSVKDVKVRWNPLYNNMPEDQAHIMTIARWGTIRSLNSTKITKREQVDAELYFMSKVVKNEVIDFNINSPRWAKLCEIHGLPVYSQNQPVRTHLLNVSITYEDNEVIKSVPRNVTVQRLQSLISRWLGIGIGYFSLEAIDIETGATDALDDTLKEVAYYGTNNHVNIRVVPS
ncbi:hypothetical protein V1511DRAFT_502092 [Dipodascopsis uninucleata]